MSRNLCKHKRLICGECIEVTDDGRRLSDCINTLRVFTNPDEFASGWIAVALADGSTDYAIYPDKQTAVDHQSNEFHYSYIFLRNCFAGMSPKDATIWLTVNRHIVANGGRIADPKTNLIMPQGREQMITRRTY